MRDVYAVAPESTAERTALWRALHAHVDAPPHVLHDVIGLALLSPDANWRERPDMDPNRAGRFRASIVSRARFIDDLVSEQWELGVRQFVVLGAGLDTFAQRKSDIALRMTVFEVDQPGPQAWKKQRLLELGFGIPESLRFVPVDFERGDSWWNALLSSGFKTSERAVVACAGVSMYLTQEAITEMLQRAATLAPGSTFAMTFLLPPKLLDAQERTGLEAAINGAQTSGTPFVSFFSPDEIVALAHEAGFKNAYCISGATLAQRYFAARADGLRPGNGEPFLIALT